MFLGDCYSDPSEVISYIFLPDNPQRTRQHNIRKACACPCCPNLALVSCYLNVTDCLYH
uniref:Uncharacterized protein n=1 Tax=Arundo donax TaxID=35708 RepID=A0A0A8XSF6_ARUDO